MVVPLATGVSENDDYQRACGRRGTPLQGTDFFGSLPQQIDQQARSRFQGAGAPLKNQGKRDVTIRTPRGSLTIRVTYYSRNCDRSREHKGLYPEWH
jgi:hypothetical protein